MDPCSLKNTAIRAIDNARDELQNIGNKLWDNPELCFEEYFSHQLLTDYLEKIGLNVERNYVLETGFKANIGSQFEGPNIAIICEYDALPNIGHACGHNLIAEAGVAAAVGLNAVFQDLDKPPGKVTILGTPAEEGGGGKVDMLRAGVFDEIDVAMMVHPGPTTSSHTSMVANDRVTVKYKSMKSRATGYPWEGVNALDAAVLCYQNVSCLRQQMKPAWRVHGIIKHSDELPNIIPPHSELQLYLRTPLKSELDLLRGKLTSCFEAAALATDCKLEYAFSDKSSWNFVTNNEMADVYKLNAESVGVFFHSREFASSASSDMGNVSQVVPCIHPGFYIGSDAFPHTCAFGEAAGNPKAHGYTLDQGKAMALTCLDLLTKKELMNSIQAEFKRQFTT